MKRPTRFLWVFFGTALLAVPVLLLAQGLVPCGNDGQPGCQLCYAVVLVDNIISWLVGVLFVIAAIIFVVAGFQLVTSGGDVSRKEAAKKKFTNTIIGFVIVLAGWLLIDTGMKALLPAQSYGVWNQIQCLEQIDPEVGEPIPISLRNISHPTANASRGTAYVTPSVSGMSNAQLQALAQDLANLDAAAADALIAQRAAELGISDQTTNIQALMRVESGGCRNNISPVGALGCMQIMPNTARLYDPSLRNLTDAQVQERLLDPTYNINLGVQIYQDLYTEYDGNLEQTFAGYNGGPGANLPSRDCLKLLRWQCEWDNQAQTIPNTGYIETRNYVLKVEETANNLQ